MGKWMDGYLKKLEKNRFETSDEARKERVEVQHSLGKMTARERIDKLIDQGSFVEIGTLIRDVRTPYDGKERDSASDGVIMGVATINNRHVMVFSMDFTVMSGSLGDQGAWKIAEAVEMAGQWQIPIIGMIDSAGQRLSIKRGYEGLDGFSKLARNMSIYSGIVPRIMMVLGPCTGPMAAIPVLADFRIINKETGFLWFGGEKKMEDAGDAEFHMEKSGQCDLIAENDEDALKKTRELLDFLPQNCWEKPAMKDTGDDPERRDEELVDIMPNDPRYTYDVHDIIDKIVDNGEFFELQEDYAAHITTGFCRMGGQVAGIVANNPDELSGIMEIDSSDKYDRFMMFLNAFDIPLITLVDSSAYVPGDKWEKVGILRHGAKNLHSYTHVTSQKVTILLRRGYGGANLTMGCSRMRPDFVFGWPTGEFSPTGPDAIIQAVFHKDLAKAKEEGKYEEMYEKYLGILREQMTVMNAKNWTSCYMIYDPIDPRDTRPKIIKALRATNNKREERPKKKAFIKPA